MQMPSGIDSGALIEVPHEALDGLELFRAVHVSLTSQAA